MKPRIYETDIPQGPMENPCGTKWYWMFDGGPVHGPFNSKADAERDSLRFSDPLRLIQDDNCHWYIIPANRQDDFYKWCKSQADGTYTGEWNPEPVASMRSLLIFDYENLSHRR